MTDHRGTNEGRHPWFQREGRPMTDHEHKLTEDAAVPRADFIAACERASTVEQLRPLVDAYYDMEGNSTGGSLHITLDDGNVEDDDLRFCIGWAEADGPYRSELPQHDSGPPDPAGAALARAILRLSVEQRKELVEDVSIGDEPDNTSFLCQPPDAVTLAALDGEFYEPPRPRWTSYRREITDDVLVWQLEVPDEWMRHEPERLKRLQGLLDEITKVCAS